MIVPVGAAGVFSYRKVTTVLTDQRRDQLASAAAGLGRRVTRRIELFAADVEGAESALAPCILGRSRQPPASHCTDALEYASDDIGWLPDDGMLMPISGSAGPLRAIGPQMFPPVAASGTALVVRTLPGGAPIALLVHRWEGFAGRLVAIVSWDYLWSGPTPDPGVPGATSGVWDSKAGPLVGLVPPRPSGLGRGRFPDSTAGIVDWVDSDGVRQIAAAWSPSSSEKLRLPPWLFMLSQRRSEVLAPASIFVTVFPTTLVVSTLAVLIFGAKYIRESLLPLEELRAGTRRIANRDFDARVAVATGDEIEELARAFNGMASQLGRQFSALRAAAEIDRAVLSSVDAATIAATVIDRLGSVCPYDGMALVLRDQDHGFGATLWIQNEAGGRSRTESRIELTSAELARLEANRTQVSVRLDGEVPSYLGEFATGAWQSIEAFPLFYGPDFLGVVALRHDTTSPEPRDHVQIRRLADQIAVALSNARMVERVRVLAFYDSLTGLPNRVLLKQYLDDALTRARRLNRLVAICFLDLDNFSRINDTLGHDLGDRLIKEVAGRLQGACREGDRVARIGGGEEKGVAVARLGGDEFTVLLPDINEPQDAARVARRLIASLEPPFRLGIHEVFVSTSVGIAVYPVDGTTAEDLLKNADVAMYHAKADGRNTYRLFSASMNAEALSRLETEQKLRRAVEREDFEVHYQPIVDAATGLGVGAEALVRWRHPERGLVSPAEFIEISEESGLIVTIGEWLLPEVCRQIHQWNDAGIHPTRIAINLSARQLRQPGAARSVGEALEASGIRPEIFVLELTESMLMEPTGELVHTLRALRALGIQLAIDDFGTGYSSLSYLKHFPVGCLKIDRSFVRDVASSSDGAAIATAIVALAKAMGLSVVAEGVETEAQAEFLRNEGCDLLQGFLFSRPLDATTFADWWRLNRQAARSPAIRSGR